MYSLKIDISQAYPSDIYWRIRELVASYNRNGYETLHDILDVYDYIWKIRATEFPAIENYDHNIRLEISRTLENGFVIKIEPIYI